MGNTISVLTEAAIDVTEIDLGAVELAQTKAQEALRIAEEEGVDYEQLEALEKSVQFLIAQKLARDVGGSSVRYKRTTCYAD